jgi:large subunit ribosomal protein L29
MATKKFLELKEMAQEDLVAELKESKNQLQKLKFDHSLKGLDNPLTIKELRRDIARLQTEISRRRINA